MEKITAEVVNNIYNEYLTKNQYRCDLRKEENHNCSECLNHSTLNSFFDKIAELIPESSSFEKQMTEVMKIAKILKDFPRSLVFGFVNDQSTRLEAKYTDNLVKELFS